MFYLGELVPARDHCEQAIALYDPRRPRPPWSWGDDKVSASSNTLILLWLLGYTEQAENHHHFSYAFVGLTPRCAEELGYELSAEDKQRPFIEISGRKGFGVKADDLLDGLIAAAAKEVDARHPELQQEERHEIAVQIAVVRREENVGVAIEAALAKKQDDACDAFVDELVFDLHRAIDLAPLIVREPSG